MGVKKVVVWKKLGVNIRIPLLTKNKEIPLFSFVRTDRQTDTHTHTHRQIKLDCVAKTSLSAEPKGCRLAANIIDRHLYFRWMSNNLFFVICERDKKQDKSQYKQITSKTQLTFSRNNNISIIHRLMQTLTSLKA